ncbi:DUF2163 domain-containing protein [uncultured Sphingomonas sp.]|uniref:DUF2163 domain-containing protein n=1 Tax=uncultured Sphingomonas sp. TaxID=158754 RepID=UPI0035CAF4EE
MSDRLTGIALTWRVERRDGIALGLTSHDRDLRIDGFDYRAAPGMTPSAVKRSDDLSADTMEVGGALTGAAITERALLAGRWDGARVAVAAVDWTSGTVIAELGEGRIGAVEVADNGFTAELAGLAALLDRPVAEATAPECRAELGDVRCRVALAPRRRFARVVAGDGAILTLDMAEPTANAYGGGRLRWFGGGNGGLDSAVAASSGDRVTLRSPPAEAPEGALVELIEGCDKSLATCAGRFANAANFRGEPYLPGIDLLTRYPGG